MQALLRIKSASLLALTVAGCFQAGAQAPGVPINSQPHQYSQDKTRLLDTAKDLYSRGATLKMAEVRRQLKRSSCQLALPSVGTTKLPARDICVAARHSHLRIGWAYLCNKCGKWHLNLAGGYALTAAGAVATCFHVVEPDPEMREGCLVAVDQTGTVFPVVEVLAANRESDACIVRVPGEQLEPLPLNTSVYPGDTAYCYSDPAGHPGYFSAGIVNRFYQLPGTRAAGARPSPGPVPTRFNVGTDWAPGSSGSAVLDDCANAIGHVAKISAIPDGASGKRQDPHDQKPAAIVFHEAVSARDVLLLIKPGRE